MTRGKADLVGAAADLPVPDAPAGGDGGAAPGDGSAVTGSDPGIRLPGTAAPDGSEPDGPAATPAESPPAPARRWPRWLSGVCLAAVLASLLADAVWLTLDRLGPIHDSFWHFYNGVVLSDLIHDGRYDLDEWAEIAGEERYGVLPIAAFAALMAVLGTSFPAVLLVAAAVCVPIWTWATARLALSVATPRAAALAVLFLVTVPGGFAYQRLLLLDLPLAAAVAGSAGLFLAACEAGHGGARHLRMAGAFGFAAAAAAIKVNALAFLLVPGAAAAVPWIRDTWQSFGRTQRRAAIEGGLMLGLPLLLLLLGWRIPKGGAFWQTVVRDTWLGAGPTLLAEAGVVEFGRAYAAAVFQQLYALVRLGSVQLLTLPVTALLLVGLPRLLGDARGRTWALGWLLPPVVLLVAVFRGDFDERYILPALPAMAVVAAIVLDRVWDRPRGRAMVAATFALSLLQASVGSFGVPTLGGSLGCVLKDGGRYDLPVGTDGVCLLVSQYSLFYRPSVPAMLDLPRSPVRESLAQRRSEIDRPMCVVFAGEISLLYYSFLHESLWGEAVDEPHGLARPARPHWASEDTLDAVLIEPGCSADLWGAGGEGAMEEALVRADAAVLRKPQAAALPGVGEDAAVSDDPPRETDPLAAAVLRRLDGWPVAGRFPLADGLDEVVVLLKPLPKASDEEEP